MILSDPKGIPRTLEEMNWAVNDGYIIPAFRNSEVTVELLLDYVDLKLDWYIPSIEAIDFINFIRLCIGEEPENKNSKPQYFFIDCIFQSEEVRPYFEVRNIDYDLLKGNTLILSTREFSKSVLIAYLLLYMASKGKIPKFGKVNFGMYVSDKMEKGNVTRTMDLLEALYNGSAYLRGLFEWTHFTNGAAEFIRKPQTRKEIDTYKKHIDSGGNIKTVPQRYKRKFKVQGLGASGGRGSGSVLDRPQFAIFDDMIGNEKDAYSQSILDSIDSTIDSDVGASLSGEGNFQILIGTAYHINDPVYKRVEEGTWLPVVFPKAEVPPHGDIFDNEGNLIEPAVTKEEFVSVWDDRHPFEKQRREYEKAERARDRGKPRLLKSVNQEFYIRVTSEHERLIPKSAILIKNCDHIWNGAKNLYWYITTDLTSTNNKSSNRSGQYLIATDFEKKWYIMKMSLRKLDAESQYATILRFHKYALSKGARWVDIGIEIDGNQSLHLSALERYYEKYSDLYPSFARQATHRKQKLTWVGIRSRGSGDKLWRLKMLEPKFLDGEVIFSDRLIKESREDWDELMRELSMTTRTEIKSDDDGLDTLSQMALIDVEYPSVPIDYSYVQNVVDPINFNGMYDDERVVFGDFGEKDNPYIMHE